MAVKRSAEKPTRGYSSTVRREQAARTRERIVEAAGELFLTEGYGRTTVRAIAERAEVAADTVYAVFGTKARVLTAVVDARLAPAGEANVMDRAETEPIRETTDQREQLRRFTHDIVGVLGRVGGIYEVMRTAKADEPAMAAIHAEMDGYRLNNMRRMIGWLRANGPLRVDDDAAAEIVWTLASPDVSRMLLEGRGWSVERYREWLEESLGRLLLPD